MSPDGPIYNAGDRTPQHGSHPPGSPPPGGNQPPWSPPPQGPGPGPAQWPGGSPQPPQRGKSPWRIVALIAGILFLVMFLFCGGCVTWMAWVGARGPDVAVVGGEAVKSHHLEVIRDLGYLESGEEILLFYSPALVDVRNIMVLLTDEKLVLHKTPLSGTQQIAFDEIKSADITFQGDFLTDSEKTVTLIDGREVQFPVSADRGGDGRFLRELQSRISGSSASDFPIDTEETSPGY